MLKFLTGRTALLATAGLGLMLLLPQTSEAQRSGRSGFGVSVGGRSGGVSFGNRPYYGGYGGYGYGGYNSPYRYGVGGYPGYGGNSYYRPYNYSSLGYYSSPGYYNYSTPGYSYAPSSYSYSAPAYYSSGNSTQSYQSFYPPESGSGQAQDNRAHVKVDVPDPNAEVFFEGQRTKQTGTEREFVSPDLTPGRDYTYSVRARWMENGQMRDQTRAVRVRPGQWVAVDFSRPDSSTASPRQDERLAAPAANPVPPAPGTPSGRPVTPPEAGRPLDQNPNSPVPPGTQAPRPATPAPVPPGTVTPPPRDDE